MTTRPLRSARRSDRSLRSPRSPLAVALAVAPGDGAHLGSCDENEEEKLGPGRRAGEKEEEEGEEGGRTLEPGEEVRSVPAVPAPLAPAEGRSCAQRIVDC